MTVAQLIDDLKKYNPNLRVVLLEKTDFGDYLEEVVATALSGDVVMVV
jgi:hypothetical protein